MAGRHERRHSPRPSAPASSRIPPSGVASCATSTRPRASIDYDPRAPGKREALRRFLRFLRPHLDRYSMGPDRATTWAELEGLAHEEGMVSVKGAVARAQGLDEGELARRLAVLAADVNGLTVGERRVGHAVAHAALAACREQRLDRPLAAAIQGFRNVGRGAALSLAKPAWPSPRWPTSTVR